MSLHCHLCALGSNDRFREGFCYLLKLLTLSNQLLDVEVVLVVKDVFLSQLVDSFFEVFQNFDITQVHDVLNEPALFNRDLNLVPCDFCRRVAFFFGLLTFHGLTIMLAQLVPRLSRINLKGFEFSVTVRLNDLLELNRLNRAFHRFVRDLQLSGHQLHWSFDCSLQCQLARRLVFSEVVHFLPMWNPLCLLLASLNGFNSLFYFVV